MNENDARASLATRRKHLIGAVHAAPHRAVIAISGGGSRALSDLLTVPGASRTVLEGIIPYSRGAFDTFLRTTPDSYCSSSVVRQLAMRAWQRAAEVEPELRAEHRLGLACTAALRSERAKRGAHRAHIAVQRHDWTEVVDVFLEKGVGEREEEERWIADQILSRLAAACELDVMLPRQGLAAWSRQRVTALPSWRQLLLGEIQRVATGRASEPGKLIFPGSFHPLHRGHRSMARIAAEIEGTPAHFEISVTNVDKPPLDYIEMSDRLSQFACDQNTVWLTNAPTFVEKARLFPGCTFVAGADTIERLVDRRYYGDDAKRRDQAVQTLLDLGSRFLVFGRMQEGRFTTGDDLGLTGPLRDRCRMVPASRFREDISSTALRSPET